jgi:hypothetical protein
MRVHSLVRMTIAIQQCDEDEKKSGCDSTTEHYVGSLFESM